MYVILSNCKFYCTRIGFLAIWFDVTGDGINTLEILGTSLSNSSGITNIVNIEYLGSTELIVAANIIDPSSY
jgi:hypothetical protein